jgi:hypothetical protein
LLLWSNVNLRAYFGEPDSLIFEVWDDCQEVLVTYLQDAEASERNFEIYSRYVWWTGRFSEDKIHK